MVSQLFLNAVGGLSVFLGLSPTNTVYLMAILFSVMFAIAVTVKWGRPLLGFGTFVAILFIFAILDAFPIWILAVGLAIIFALFQAGHGGGSE